MPPSIGSAVTISAAEEGDWESQSGGHGGANLHLPLSMRAAVVAEPSAALWGFCCSDAGESEGSKSQETVRWLA